MLKNKHLLRTSPVLGAEKWKEIGREREKLRYPFFYVMYCHP